MLVDFLRMKAGGEISKGGKPSQADTVKTHNDIGVTRSQADRYQQIADVPEAEFPK